ncbi:MULTISPECIES: type III-B CRISPR module RAMP protein Cmr4 [unclassified Bradyrhizobium]|uniref:type III-B CRISPR module RAMP protein Cmr4 n=1 Tax=unclassified Bradyrhizobium TaxID=2631580 RepID=UPI0029169817|nr:MULTISPECIES: type III-B CRISPR module RAMP protein Cmr4 [unclassified Bradyrhizobium]
MTPTASTTDRAASSNRFIWLRAETFIHVGAGETSSLIDLPFARESGTSYPYIPGSGMKGAYRAMCRVKYPAIVTGDEEHATDDPRLLSLFGEQDNAGPVLVSDARLAFLPLRSLSSAFVLATCPNVLQRLVRDRRFAGGIAFDPAMFLANLENWDEEAVQSDPAHGDQLFIEEFRFPRGDPGLWDALRPGLEALLTGLDGIPDAIRRVAIVSDPDFGFFTRRRLHVRSRNRLLPISKTVATGALWSEESLPPETIMYNILSARGPAYVGKLTELTELIHDSGCGYLQVGGNETVGEGWLSLHGAQS